MKKRLLALKLEKTTAQEQWLKIGVTGHWKGHYAGEFELDNASYQQMIDNAIKRGLDIVVDYEHETLWGGKAPAGGWISIDPLGLKIDGEDFYAQIEWTQAAVAHIEAREYRYLSPVFVPNTIDPVTGNNVGWTLHSIALTNTPFLSELGAITNKQKEQTMGLQEDLDKARQDLGTAQADSAAKDTKISDLEKALETSNKEQVEAMVNSAVSDGKIAASQKDWAIALALSDRKSFDDFLVSVTSTPPNGEMFKNSNNPAGATTIILSKI